MIDERDNGDVGLYGIYKRFKQHHPELGRSLISIGFGDDAAYPPIQAADLLGNCFHKALRNRSRDQNASLSFNLLTRRLLPNEERGYGEFVFDDAALANTCEQRQVDPTYLPDFA